MSHRILIVDDEPCVREALSMLLLSLGHTVETASDGDEAFEMLCDRMDRADLILLDYRMPRMSGGEFLARAEKGNMTTPVILMSACLDSLDETHFKRSMVKASVAKPFGEEKLVELMGMALGKDLN